ncbi:alpha/beta fold hydrolase [Nocardia aurantia]|uniref:2-succinyl-6-hydroxy-2, 4-cyclohexadiene-1-carboxylate synthase n=1 Tax=Nocardia aurantia TaxID=2585199 RepID=A0A7K0DV75_9NOCA|nr:alpha/beta fold hydrolase [Nocardia aurantia]MQY29645.1 2-succinyl-6-hydroxy-2,4-cyclohexadiene-1-carboxylate synthase [Nocardia aurantia]
MSDLNMREWGDGDRTAVLIHGLTAESTSWWRAGPALADRGYHVYAPDLPGHGASPRASGYRLDAVADAVAAAIPAEPDLALGHSLGGLVLATIVDRVRPARVVYEDPAWLPGHQAIVKAFRAQKDWTLDEVRAANPRWAPEVWQLKLDALSHWDTATLDVVDGFPGYDPAPPRTPALLLLADPSLTVPPDRAAELATRGFEVRTVADTGHVIHNDDFDGFLAGLDGWL